MPKNWVKNLKGISKNLKNAVNNNLGNLWIIDAGTNSRWLDNFSPRDKFEEIKRDISIIKGGIRKGKYLDNLCLTVYKRTIENVYNVYKDYNKKIKKEKNVNQTQPMEEKKEERQEEIKRKWREILRNREHSGRIATAIKKRGNDIIKKVTKSLGIKLRNLSLQINQLYRPV